MEKGPTVKAKLDYGIDSPFIGLQIFSVIIAALAIGIFLNNSSYTAARVLASIILSFAPAAALVIILMILYIKIGKFMHRDKMLRMLPIEGYEQVLDIGTGHGLLMIGAAKKLTTGKSFGIDIWNEEDLSDNNYEFAIRNAKLEAVSEKVEIVNADACRIPFTDNSFDYILSNLCLHNIDGKQNRSLACGEITRLLKPGGIALISDFRYIQEYTREFKKMGLTVSVSTSIIPAPMLLRIIKVEKK